jgi:hypothetical protein
VEKVLELSLLSSATISGFCTVSFLTPDVLNVLNIAEKKPALYVIARGEQTHRITTPQMISNY